MVSLEMAFVTRPPHTRHQRLAAKSLPLRLRAWREDKNPSQSEAALKLQISKLTLQEWEQARSTAWLCAHRGRKGDSCLANHRAGTRRLSPCRPLFRLPLNVPRAECGRRWFCGYT